MLAGRVVQSCTCSRVAGPKCVPPAPQRRSALVVRASASQPSPDVAEKQPEASSSALKSRQQRQQDMAQDRAAKQSDPSAPRRCKEAIDRGLALFGDKKVGCARFTAWSLVQAFYQPASLGDEAVPGMKLL